MIRADASHSDKLDEAGCFTEDYLNSTLPPIPDWMREAPRTKEAGLFDDQD